MRPLVQHSRSRRYDRIFLIPLQPGQLEFFPVNLDWGCRKGRVVEVDVLVIQTNDNNRMVDIFLPVGQFAGLNESKAGPALAQMIKQILKATVIKVKKGVRK